MLNFIKDILLYPVIVIQMILVGPFLWAANNNNVNNQQKAETRSKAQKAKLDAGKGRARSTGAYKRNKANGNKSPKRGKANQANVPRQGKAKKFNGYNTGDKVFDKNTPYSGPRVKPEPYLEVGEIERLATTYDQLAKEQYQQLIITARQYFKDKQIGDRSAYSYYQTTKDGVTYLANTKAGRITKHGLRDSWGIGGQRAKRYYIKQGQFFSESANEFMKFEMGNPASQFLSRAETKKAIDKRFNELVKNWANSGHYSHVSGTRHLRETLSNMYRQATMQVVMGTLQISQAQYKQEFDHIIKGALKVAQEDMSRFSKDFFKDIRRVLTGQLPKSELIRSLGSGNSAEYAYSMRNGKVRALNTNYLGTGFVTKSIKLWPLETFYFNMAIVGSSSILASIYDDTFNPLYAKENEEMRHAGFKTEDMIGFSLPMLEALDLGFLGFIVGNQGFQKIAPYGKVPMFMRGYVGMGVGSVVSSMIHSVKDSPAWMAYKSASKKFTEARDRAEELPEGSAKQEALTEMLMWKTISNNAHSVVWYDLKNSKFWKDQIDHIFTLIGASLAAAGATKLFTKAMQKPLNAQKARMEQVKNYKGKTATLANHLTKSVANGKQLGAFKKVASMIAFRVKDFLRGTVSVLFAHPVLRLVHFTLFLLMDPLVRAMSVPVTKIYRATDAYNTLKEIQEELPNKRRQLNKGIWYDRLVMDIYEGKESWYQRVFNSGPYQDLASTYWDFKDYFDQKMGFRMKSLESVSHKHMNWKSYLEKFTVSSVAATTMYRNLESSLLTAREYKEQGHFPKGLIKPDLLNRFNYTQYANLHKESRELIKDTFVTMPLYPEFKDYGFDNNDLALWQTDLYDIDLEGVSKGMKDKLAYIGPVPNFMKDSLSSDQISTVEIKIQFRNSITESILWGMAFGPDVTKDQIFTPKKGDFPEFRYPSIITGLDYKEPRLRDMQIDLADMTLVDSSPASQRSSKINVTYAVPLTLIKFYDNVDGTYKNIVQLINDRAIEDIKLGNKDGENYLNVDQYLKKYVVCNPEEIASDDKIANFEQATHHRQCDEDSVWGSLGKYEAIFANFVKEDVSRLITRTTNQSIWDTKQFAKWFSTRVLFGGALQLFASEKHAAFKKEEVDFDLLADMNLNSTNSISENLFISQMEDIVNAGGFLQAMLPTAEDFDARKQRGYYERATQIELQNRGKTIAAQTAMLANNYLDVILGTSSADFFSNKKFYADTVTQMEQDFNKAMCYLHGRSVEIDKEDPKSSGAVSFNGSRYYRYYNKKNDNYEFTRIEPNAYCDFDQIASKIDVTSVIDEEAQQLVDGEEEIDMSSWIQFFQSDEKEPLHPSNASLQNIREYYGYQEGQDDLALVDKILESIFVPSNKVVSPEDRDESRKAKEILQQNIELATEYSHIAAQEEAELRDFVGLGINQEQQEKDMISQVFGIPGDKIIIKKNRKLRPYMTLRVAVASKAINMLRRIIDEEAGQFHPYLMSMKKYAPTEYDTIAPVLCKLREKTGVTYGKLTGGEPMKTAETVVCSEYDDMFITEEHPSDRWFERQDENLDVEEKYKETYDPGFELRRWWEHLWN